MNSKLKHAQAVNLPASPAAVQCLLLAPFAICNTAPPPAAAPLVATLPTTCVAPDIIAVEIVEVDDDSSGGGRRRRNGRGRCRRNCRRWN